MIGEALNYPDTRQELSGILDALMEKITVRPSMLAAGFQPA
ncbi:hypothetical protein [Zymomonas mobilis]|nr:hypothetical protein [Zymomonas mobilis]